MKTAKQIQEVTQKAIRQLELNELEQLSDYFLKAAESKKSTYTILFTTEYTGDLNFIVSQLIENGYGAILTTNEDGNRVLSVSWN